MRRKMSKKKRNRLIAETDGAENNIDAYHASADATAEFKTTKIKSYIYTKVT